MRQKSMHKRRGVRHSVWVAPAVILAVAGLLFHADRAARPIIYSLVEYECKAMAVQSINETVLRNMQNRPELFRNLCQVQRSSDGKIQSITTDTYSISRLKLELTGAVNDALVCLEDSTHLLPVGNLLGTPLLSGFGPRLRLKLISEAYAESEISSGFSSAGVNQTRFSIDITFDVTISAMMGGYTTSLSTLEKIPLSEMILQGEVPKLYAAA